MSQSAPQPLSPPGRQPTPALVADPPVDAAHSAGLVAFVLPSHGSGMDAVMYTAAGAGPHPTLLLLHGFPGNEQNLDLAQAARRSGWNVLTFHYRGSWGSEGAFSFGRAAEDAVAALAWLRRPDTIARFAIDPARIAVAGHSMGGVLGAGAAAGDPAVIGTFLIEPANMAGTGRRMKADPAFRRRFVEEELRGDLPPLAGTGEAQLVAELESAPLAIDLAHHLPALAGRPLVLAYASRAIGATDRVPMEAVARQAGATRLTVVEWPTDHSFSDHRIALTDLLLRWLAALPR
ncbi:MAG: alpha/beta hydrolase family protein [Janthinobacterium lividum]